MQIHRASQLFFERDSLSVDACLDQAVDSTVEGNCNLSGIKSKADQHSKLQFGERTTFAVLYDHTTDDKPGHQVC